jgi:pyrroloquinoline-quinone synthase
MGVPLNRGGYTRDEFERMLVQAVGKTDVNRRRFTQLLVAGKASRELLRGWAINWYFFERNVPRKDGAIISNCDLVDVRRLWVTKILEHDGYGRNEGAIEGWLRFATGLGVPREEVTQGRYIEDVVDAVDNYVEFAKSKSWLEGVAMSVGMVFVPMLVEQRLLAFRKHYPWVEQDSLDYFRTLYSKARRDGRMALQLVIKYADGKTVQRDSIRAAEFGGKVQERILLSVMREYGVPERE